MRCADVSLIVKGGVACGDSEGGVTIWNYQSGLVMRYKPEPSLTKGNEVSAICWSKHVADHVVVGYVVYG